MFQSAKGIKAIPFVPPQNTHLIAIGRKQKVLQKRYLLTKIATSQNHKEMWTEMTDFNKSNFHNKVKKCGLLNGRSFSDSTVQKMKKLKALMCFCYV